MEERNVVECERLYSVDDVGVIKYVTENRVSRIDSPLLNFLARLQQLFFPESFVRKRERERAPIHRRRGKDGEEKKIKE